MAGQWAAAGGGRPPEEETLPQRAASWALLQAQEISLDYRSALRAAALAVALAVLISSVTGCGGCGRPEDQGRGQQRHQNITIVLV